MQAIKDLVLGKLHHDETFPPGSSLSLLSHDVDVDDDDKSFLVALTDLLVHNSEMLQDIFWELLPSLFHAIDEIPSELFDSIHELVGHISRTCSAREVLLVLDNILVSTPTLLGGHTGSLVHGKGEQLVKQAVTTKKVMCIFVLKEALLRITRRNSFMERVAEISLRLVQSVAKSSGANTNDSNSNSNNNNNSNSNSNNNSNNNSDSDSDSTSGGVEDMGSVDTEEATVQILNNNNIEVVQTDKEEEDRVVTAVVDMVVAVVEDVARRLESTEENKGEGDNREWVDLCKQKTRLVTLVFSLLAEPVLVARQSKHGPIQLAGCIIQLKVPYTNVLEYGTRNNIVIDDDDDDDGDDDDDDDDDGDDGPSSISSSEVGTNKWVFAGIGHFLYCVVVRYSELVSLFQTTTTTATPTTATFTGIERMIYYYPCVFAPSYTFDNMQSYIIRLIQQAHNGAKGLALAYCVVKTIPPASHHTLVQINSNSHWGLTPVDSNPQLMFFKALITWTVQCGYKKARTKAHHLFQSTLSCFAASSRFSILSALMPSPYSVSSALFIHRLKQEIDNSYHEDKFSDTSPAFFVSNKIMEMLPLFMHTRGNLMDRMDELIAGLNLYRYLLIKDRSQNKTGIWSTSQIAIVQGQFLEPLKDKSTKLLAQFSSPKQDSKHTKILGLPQLSDEEYQHAAAMATNSILLLGDLISRVEEIVQMGK